MKKTFDCLEMKHRGAELVQARLGAMSRAEELEYWRQRTENLRKRQRELRAARAAADSNAGSQHPDEPQESEPLTTI